MGLKSIGFDIFRLKNRQLKESLKDAILKELKSSVSRDIQINSVVRQGGGDINEAAKLSTSEGDFFVKWNDQIKYPLMFDLEKDGLQEMKNIGGIRTPRFIATGFDNNIGFLILEWVEKRSMSREGWLVFGEELAKMHSVSQSGFGFSADNYIGSLPQYNDNQLSWVDFFIMNRIDVQLEIAHNNSAISKELSRKFQKLYSRLDQLIPKEAPALLHGDLWNGNYIPLEDHAMLIDPAVYYGHREMDLAMMHLFGGFDPEIFTSYNSLYPLENGWKERLDLHNLYPLLVHVNLFGGSYANQVRDIVSRFI